MPFRQPDPQSRRSPNRGIRRIFIGSWRGWLALVILGLTAAGVVYMKKEVQKTAKPDFGREPVKETIFVAAGVEARITGADGDLFEIWRDGARIYFHRIQDGQHLSKADVKSVSVGGSDYNIAVRHGTDRDIFFCYAIRETSVYRNPSPVRFGQGQPGNNFDFEWISPTTLRIRYPKGLGYVDWQPITKTWSVRG